MASSNEKVVYAFQIFEKRLVLYIFNKKPEKKMFANTASLIIQIKIVFRDICKTFSKIDVYQIYP